MARKLTKPMKEALRIMAEGHTIRQRDKRYEHYSFHPRREETINARTLYALIQRNLVKQEAYYFRDYALTEAGRRAEEELVDA